MSQHINIENFQGILGDVAGSNVQQNLNMAIVPGNFDSLVEYLKKYEVAIGDINELETAIRLDPEPVNKEKLGGEVSTWIGKMVWKAAQGGWNIGLGAAGNLLASAIAKFYGLS